MWVKKTESCHEQLYPTHGNVNISTNIYFSFSFLLTLGMVDFTHPLLSGLSFSLSVDFLQGTEFRYIGLFEFWVSSPPWSWKKIDGSGRTDDSYQESE